MRSAVPEPHPITDRARCVEAVVRGITRLAEDFDINVRFDRTTGGDGATTDPVTRTVIIDHRLDVGDIAFLIRDLWNYLTIGPHASLADEVPGPALVLVPPTPLLPELDEAFA